jgi:glycosyltransferase involved in cell wall biosynthesis
MRLTSGLVELALGRALSGVGRRPVVVVTDRYPPHAHGGAEVSLHIVLSALRAKREVLVVSVGDGDILPERYAIDGMTVLKLPRQAKWPHPRVPQGVAELAGRLPDRWQRRLMGAGASVSDSALEVEVRRRHRAGALRPRGGAVVDFLEYPRGLAVALLREVLRRTRPALVHADNYRSILIAAEASRGMDVGRVGVVRDNRFHCVRYDQSVQVRGRRCRRCDLACAEDDFPEAPDLQRRMLRRTSELRLDALRRMDRVVVTSEYLRGSVAALLGTADRIVRIPNAPDDWEQARDAMLGVAERVGTNILVVGMLNENKGQLPLVAHLDDLVRLVPDAVLHFAGRGARIEAKLRERAAERGCGERLVFHGHLDRAALYRLYRECQIVALPTIWPEPFGRVPLEAGLARRPVVTFAVGGLRESIRHGDTGFLVRPGDWDTFVERLTLLANDPLRARRMGEHAHRHILDTYRVNEMRDELVRLWSTLRAEREIASHG